jgi:hypothetical protein
LDLLNSKPNMAVGLRFVLGVQDWKRGVLVLGMCKWLKMLCTPGWFLRFWLKVSCRVTFMLVTFCERSW